MPIKDRFTQLKTSIFGVRTADIDQKLDKAVKDISLYKSQSGRNGYIDLVRSILSKGGHIDVSSLGAGGLFGQASSPAMLGQGGRLLRYRTYEAIISNISYCNRALQVLTDNILSPDDITKIALEIKAMEDLQDKGKTDSNVSLIKKVIRKLKVEENLSRVVRNTLLFGDYFCEIADTKTALTSRAVIAEYLGDNRELVAKRDLIEVEAKDLRTRIIMDFSLYEDEKSSNNKEEKSGEKEGEIKLNDLNLVFHDPKFVVKLQSDLFPLCFGYLVFPKMMVTPHLNLQDHIVNQICSDILKSIEKRIPHAKELQNNEDLRDILKTMIRQTDYSRALNVRYIPPEKMQHFLIPTSKYHPYGESVFDACNYNAKVLIALETALAIQRLTRSTEKRKIAIEIGLPRDARKAIEKMKEEFRKRKISLDSFGTVDTIPSMITTFEDIYVPQKDGKPFVDISSFNEGMTDVRGKVDELKFIRDSVVACLGVPPSFLNIEENLSNKSALTEENILFARTVVNHQKYLTHQLNDLLKNILTIVYPERSLLIMDNVLVAFATPKALQFEREARYLSDLANMIDTLDRIGIPKEYAKKKYLPQIDWGDVEAYEVGEKIDKNLGTEEQSPETGGFGGLGGLGGGMAPLPPVGGTPTF